MSFPFDHFVEDKNVPPNTLYIINPRYKFVQVNQGEPPMVEKVLDMEATARASVVIKNVAVPQKP